MQAYKLINYLPCLKTAVFRDVMPLILLQIYRHFVPKVLLQLSQENYSSTLKTQATSSETSINFYLATHPMLHTHTHTHAFSPIPPFPILHFTYLNRFKIGVAKVRQKVSVRSPPDSQTDCVCDSNDQTVLVMASRGVSGK